MLYFKQSSSFLVAFGLLSSLMKRVQNVRKLLASRHCQFKNYNISVNEDYLWKVNFIYLVLYFGLTLTCFTCLWPGSEGMGRAGRCNYKYSFNHHKCSQLKQMAGVSLDRSFSVCEVKCKLTSIHWHTAPEACWQQLCSSQLTAV